MTWRKEWVCTKCGYAREAESHFFAYGFHFTCPGCGKDLGDLGGGGNVGAEVVRYNSHPDKKLWKPWTWFLPSTRVVQDEDD